MFLGAVYLFDPISFAVGEETERFTLINTLAKVFGFSAAALSYKKCHADKSLPRDGPGKQADRRRLNP